MKKKIFQRISLLLTLACISLGFAACSNDDEPKVEDKYTTEYTFEAEFSADLLAVVDVKAYILSPDGVVTQEAVTKAKNTWKLKGNSIPDKAGVLLEFQAKSGEFSGDYLLGYKVSSTITCLNNNLVVSTDSKGYEETFTVPVENLSYFYGTGIPLGGEITSAGKAGVTDGSNLDFGLNGALPRPGIGPIF